MTLNHLVSFFRGTFQKFVQGNAYQVILIKSYSQIRVTSKRYFYYIRDINYDSKNVTSSLYISLSLEILEKITNQKYR